MEGFEPSNTRTKNGCLTTWPHSKKYKARDGLEPSSQDLQSHTLTNYVIQPVLFFYLIIGE